MADGVTGCNEPTLADFRACRDTIVEAVSEFSALDRAYADWLREPDQDGRRETRLKERIRALAYRGELRHFRYPNQLDERLCIFRHFQKAPGPYDVGEISGRTWTEVMMLVLSHCCDLLQDFEARFLDPLDAGEAEALATRLRVIWHPVRQAKAHHEACIEIYEAMKGFCQPAAPPPPPVHVTLSMYPNDQTAPRGLADAGSEMPFNDPLLVLMGERMKVYEIAQNKNLRGEERLQMILKTEPALASWDSPLFARLLGVDESTIRKWKTWKALQVKQGKRVPTPSA